MKKLLFTLGLSLFLGCQSEEVPIPVLDIENESLFIMNANTALDNSRYGLYHGVLNSFDTELKGEIIINLGNNGQYMAEARFLNGETLIFTTEQKGVENIRFKSKLGNFTIISIEDKTVAVDNLIIDGKSGYIRAYKESNGIEVNLALGIFVDDLDPMFQGNWDMFNLGNQTNPEGLPVDATPAYVIEKIVVSSPGGTVFEDTDFDLETPPLCIDYPSFVPYIVEDVFGDSTYSILEAYNQTSIFGGIQCDWGLSFFIFEGDAGFRDENCMDNMNGGAWAWNGRSGAIFVSDLFP